MSCHTTGVFFLIHLPVWVFFLSGYFSFIWLFYLSISLFTIFSSISCLSCFLSYTFFFSDSSLSRLLFRSILEFETNSNFLPMFPLCLHFLIQSFSLFLPRSFSVNRALPIFPSPPSFLLRSLFLFFSIALKQISGEGGSDRNKANGVVRAYV